MKRAFTLIELLVVVAIIAVLTAILLPSLSSARSIARRVKCLTNLKALAGSVQNYLETSGNVFPVRDNAVVGGGSIYNSFLPSRIMLRSDRRPLAVLACPEDAAPQREYQVGDGTSAFPESLGIGDIYLLAPTDVVRISYGINNMTGVQPANAAERIIFNPNAGAYRRPAETMLYADSAYFNVRTSNVTLNDEPRLKGRIANAAAPNRMASLPAIPVEYGVVQPRFSRHRGGSNVVFMDHHGALTTQKDCFETVLYSWSERYGNDRGEAR